MTSNILKFAAEATAFIGLIALTACSDNNLETPDKGVDDSAISIVLKGISAPSAGASGDTQDALSVFQFSNNGLFSKTIIKNYDPTEINLVKGTTQTLYCLSGIDLDASEEITAKEFAKTTISTSQGENTAPLFLSAWTEVESTQMNCELTMRRGVARIDLDARDADMNISEITIDDAPASSYVFVTDAGKLSDVTTTVYTHTWETSPTGIESGLFMLFESAGDVHATIRGTVGGKEITVPAVIPGVERNKVYTLRVYDKNASIKAVFSVTDWEDGGVTDGNPDTTGRLAFDMAKSVFPEGVTVDYANNVIDVPSTGVAGMKIAFTTDLRIDMDSIYFSGARVEADSIKEKYVDIRAEKPENTTTGVVTRFAVDIEGQLKGRPGYEIKMDLRKMNMTSSYDNLTIRVAQSPYQIQTVEMGGITWMAFNAVSPDLGEQVFPADGLTVEETYQQHWAMSIGNFFQYGRQKGYSPWTGNDPNGNEDTPRNIPWTDPACMPLPEGYHVATTADWQKLLPNGTQIPSTYTAANGEQIKCEVIVLPGTLDDSPSAAANKAKLQKRYIRFESLDTHNVLIIPVCGMKTASWSEYPGGGRAMHDWVTYWIAEDRYVWLFQVSNNNGAFSATQGRDRWNYNGFLPVRGVKD